MNPKKYIIQYDWNEGRDGHFMYFGYFETDWFIVALFKFLQLKFKYDIIDVHYNSTK